MAKLKLASKASYIRRIEQKLLSLEVEMDYLEHKWKKGLMTNEQLAEAMDKYAIATRSLERRSNFRIVRGGKSDG